MFSDRRRVESVTFIPTMSVYSGETEITQRFAVSLPPVSNILRVVRQGRGDPDKALTCASATETDIAHS